MCRKCEENKAKVLERADEIADFAVLFAGGTKSNQDFARLIVGSEALHEGGYLNPPNLLLLVAHYYSKLKTVSDDNQALREAMDVLANNGGDESIQKAIQPKDALLLVESIVNTFEAAQVRAMEGANAQIRELKNRYGLNK